MMQILISFLTFIISTTFIQMNHPLAMGLILLIQTTLISLLTGLFSSSFWFSYILFLIFLGGMLVLFIYVTSLASNEMFSLSSKLMIMASIMCLIMILSIILIDKQLIYNFLENNEMEKINQLNFFIKENISNLNKLYNLPTNLTTILLINYLLITLIASVKITNISKGPLRHMN